MTTKSRLCLSVALAAALCAVGYSAPPATAFQEPVPLFQFGSGSPDGPYRLSFPWGVAVDSADGSVYVTDASEGLKKFDGDGNFITEWNAGSGRGVAANTITHDVYVARPQSAKISQYTADGVFIREWGTAGSGDGEFFFPNDVDVDSSTGEVYVIDGKRVQVFDAAGNYLRQWGSVGTGPGQFGGYASLYCIAFDPFERSVWVSEAPRQTIHKFDEWGNFLLSWKTTEPCGCQSPDQMRWIREIAVGADGNLYVADADGERISVWSPDGTLVDSFRGPHNGDDGPFHPRGIAVNQATGQIYAAAGYAARLDKFDASRSHIESWGDRQRDGAIFFNPRGIAVSPVSGEVYVLDAYNTKLKRFTSTGEFINQWGKNRLVLPFTSEPPEGALGFWSSAITVDSNGDIWQFNQTFHYAGDPLQYELQHFDAEGLFQSGWLTAETYTKKRPYGGALDESTGRVFVADQAGVKIYNSAGGEIGWIDGLTNAGGLLIDGGFLYAVDYGTMAVRKYDLDGNPITQWGSPGSEDGQFAFFGGSGLSADSLGNIYVADTANHRIQVFDPDGGFLGKFGSYGSAPGRFNWPFGLAVSKISDTLYVSEMKGERLQAFALETATACADGMDNDGDGLIDYPDDPACTSLADPSEDAARRFCVSGSSNAVGWSWSVSGVGFFVQDLVVPPVPDGGDAEALAEHFSTSLNDAAYPGLTASVDPAAPHCFTVEAPETSGTYALCVGSTGESPSCCVDPDTSCSFNPDLFEFKIHEPLLEWWRFWGPAQGGSIDFIMAGVTVQVTTTNGDLGVEIAAAVALAINGNADLAAAGITAAAVGNSVTTNGLVTAFTANDSGIDVKLVPPAVPSLSAKGTLLVALLVMASTALYLRRRALGTWASAESRRGAPTASRSASRSQAWRAGPDQRRCRRSRTG